jgi:hypothetical protein
MCAPCTHLCQCRPLNHVHDGRQRRCPPDPRLCAHDVADDARGRSADKGKNAPQPPLWDRSGINIYHPMLTCEAGTFRLLLVKQSSQIQKGGGRIRGRAGVKSWVAFWRFEHNAPHLLAPDGARFDVTMFLLLILPAGCPPFPAFDAFLSLGVSTSCCTLRGQRLGAHTVRSHRTSEPPQRSEWPRTLSWMHTQE